MLRAAAQQARARDRCGAARFDALGVGLLAAFVGWAWLCSLGHPDAHPATLSLLVGAAAAAYVAGRGIGAMLPVAVPAAVAGGVAVATALSPDALRNMALAGPLGYGNADGALLAQGVVAVGLVAVTSRHRVLRFVALAGAAALVVATALTGSKAAAVLAAAVLVVTVLAHRLSLRRFATVGGLVLVCVAIAGSVALGAAYRPGGFGQPTLDRAIADTLTLNRPRLWSDALALTARHPLRGVGADRFKRTSPTALADPACLRWASSEYLQEAAETGVVGGVLALALVGWGFMALWRSPRADAIVAVGASGLAAVSAQAAQDYVLHFAAVPLVAAVLLGVATARTSDVGSRPAGSRRAS